VASFHQSQKDEGATVVYANFAQRSLDIVRHLEFVQLNEDVEQRLVYSPTVNIIEAASPISL
jgi:N-formylglutamate amidohydrolase